MTLALAKSQADDKELEQLHNTSSLKLEKVNIPGTNSYIYCDISTGKPRPYLTPAFRRKYFNKLHGLSHPGTRASARLIADRFVWPNMQKDCREWARTCLACQRSKVSRHIKSPLQPFTATSQRFHHVHIDIIGPLPHSKNFQYCLTAIDRVTRWPEAWPMVGISAEEVAEVFHREWIARFGVPSIVTTDQGRQFESSLFNRLLNICGIERVRTTSYHPQANGMVERMHRQLKASLMCHNNSWTTVLPLVLLGMRSALKEDLNTSSAELLYGEALRLPGEFVTENMQLMNSDGITDLVTHLRRHMRELKAVPARHHITPGSFVFKDLQTATHVFLRDDTVRRSLQPPYSGPHLIKQRRDKTLTLDVNGRTVTVSIDRVKPAHIEGVTPPIPRVIHNLPQPSTTAAQPLPTSTATTPILKQQPLTTPSPIFTRTGRQVRFKQILDL